MGDIRNTQYFKAVQEDKKMEVSQVLQSVYEALTEKGYNPINLIMKVERDEILEELMENYIETRLK